MTDLYLCRHCDEDVGTPKPFAMVVACPNCKLITAASVALALGALKQAGPANPVETPGISMPSEVDRLRGTNASLERQLEKAIAQLNEREQDLADEAAAHRITQVNRDTWRSNYHEAMEALRAMQDAFDIGQPATPTSAIGKARAVLKVKL